MVSTSFDLTFPKDLFERKRVSYSSSEENYYPALICEPSFSNHSIRNLSNITVERRLGLKQTVGIFLATNN